MSDYVIKVEKLGKSYQIRHQRERYTALRDVLAEGAKNAARGLLRRPPAAPDATREEFWALQDVSFEVKQGERLGIIGRNGAGKSTLLKILSRITEPTRGEVRLRGRVASLLEVGTGFHPELTGRENIYLNGAILGMTRAEIRRKFDEIVAFAEVEKFLDTPVKRYSSGMYVRLAFAVAAHLEPEILLVDEVLAVGDAEFQKKCLGKMEEIGESGRTILFVSHNMGAIQNLCSRAILLKSGNMTVEGSPANVISSYLQASDTLRGKLEWDEQEIGNEVMTLQSIALLNQFNEITTNFDFLEPIIVEIKYIIHIPQRVRVTVWLRSENGTLLFYVSESPNEQEILIKEEGYYKVKCKIPAHLLNENRYYVSVRADIPGVQSIIKEESIINFYVHATSGVVAYREYNQGLICPEVEWVIFKSKFAQISSEDETKHTFVH